MQYLKTLDSHSCIAINFNTQPFLQTLLSVFSPRLTEHSAPCLELQVYPLLSSHASAGQEICQQTLRCLDFGWQVFTEAGKMVPYKAGEPCLRKGTNLLLEQPLETRRKAKPEPDTLVRIMLGVWVALLGSDNAFSPTNPFPIPPTTSMASGSLCGGTTWKGSLSSEI